ncbi:MAG: saccharopine dehydrogenase NADP-binding domain-containing protein [Alphaproteobacteria bacterium]|nr:saccharopine dehydrogenase NADP-binding domain-containing protein [Alphaproteobacteria bacterium]
MANKAEVVVYGASGYTGKLINERLAQRGIPFIAAGRSQKRLEEALAELPSSAKVRGEPRTVEHNERALTELFKGARVVVNVTGPFGQIGRPVAEATLAAGAHYVDTTGEPDWMQLLKSDFHEGYKKKRLVCCPALAYMWAAGEVAAELALETDGIDSVDVLYAPASLPTIASTLSFLRMVTKGQYFLLNNQLALWPKNATITASVPHAHQIMRCLPWGGGAEPLWYQDHPRVRNARTVVALSDEGVNWILSVQKEYEEAAKRLSPAELEELTNKWGNERTPVSPPRENPDYNRTVISVRARGRNVGREVVLYGSASYEQTGVFIAEGVQRLLEGKEKGHGWISPSQAFGHRELIRALVEDNFLQEPPPRPGRNG